MDGGDGEAFDTPILTVEQLIDICLSPFHIDVNLLHTLLNIIASKLNLHNVRVQLGSSGIVAEVSNMINKSKEFETFRVVEGGAKKPFKLNNCKLEKIDIEPEAPIEVIYRLKKGPTEGKDFHRVTFFKEGPATQALEPAVDVPVELGLTYSEMLNITKRLECCEIGIEKLSQLLQRMSKSYRELERSFLELSSSEINRRSIEEDIKRIEQVDRCSEHDSKQYRLRESQILRLGKDQEARKDITRIQDTLGSVIDQANTLFEKMSEFRGKLQTLRDENEMLRKVLEKAADREKLERCCKEICSMQKSMAQFTDKLSDLIACSNKSNQRFKSVNEKLGEMQKIRANHQKIENLEEVTRDLAAEFENFTERIEQMKLLKADREELDFLFQCKADKEQLQDLVTLEVFNAIRHDLSNGIVQAFENIMEAEIKWKRSEEEICMKLNNKLDKSEKGPLTKLVNDKVTQLQEKMNEFLGFKLDKQSAGVRTRALKDANCICCSGDADINCDKSALPKFPTARHIHNICPDPPDPRKRYCGGSHTVLSPEQKLNQRRSMPTYSDVSPDPPNLVEGATGTMYRVSRPECICAHRKYPKTIKLRSDTDPKEDAKSVNTEIQKEAGDN